MERAYRARLSFLPSFPITPIGYATTMVCLHCGCIAVNREPSVDEIPLQDLDNTPDQDPDADDFDTLKRLNRVDADTMSQFIRIDPHLRLAFCRNHGAHGRESIFEHLKNKHGLSPRNFPSMRSWLASLDLRESVTSCPRPPDGAPPIPDLPIYDGFQCAVDPACRFFSISHKATQAHYTSLHAPHMPQEMHSKKFSQGTHYTTVHLQTFSSYRGRRDFFIVKLPPPPSADVVSGSLSLKAVLNDLNAEEEDERQIPSADHVLVFTPWLNQSRFRSHLQGLDLPTLTSKTAVPTPHDPWLYNICQSVDRNMRRAMAALEYDPGNSSHFTLEQIDARRLNTFRSYRVSQDPIKALQTKASKTAYIREAKRLISYFARLSDGKFQGRTMFRPTPEQDLLWSLILNQDQDDTDELDRLTREFTTNLVMHDTGLDRFNSVVYSFAAASYCHPEHGLEIDLNNYGSLLAKLTYVGQMWLLAHCLDSAQNDPTSFAPLVKDVSARWLNNEERTPLGHILTIRPIARALGLRQSGREHIQWSSDNQSVKYDDTVLSVTSIRELVTKQCARVKTLFYETLCFGLSDVPSYKVTDISDDWHHKSVDYSFVTDDNNKDLFKGAKAWLATRISSTPGLATRFWKLDTDGTTVVYNVKAIQKYEDDVQNFLDALAVCIHITSGQPARITEFTSMTWCNSTHGARNLRIHEGFVKFVISYHKSQNQLGFGICPVRVLLPEIGDLLVQFLVLVQPLRTLLSKKVPDSKPVSPSGCLWSKNGHTWTTNRFTDALQKAAQSAVGAKLSSRGWRHISKAMSVKKLGVYLHMIEQHYTGHGPPDERPFAQIPDALHKQSSHKVSVGTRLYGRSMEFGAALNDSSMTDYTRISLAWHAFLQDQRIGEPETDSRKRPFEDDEPETSGDASLESLLQHRSKAPRLQAA